ncbi:MAG: DUF2380 domain-containing protein [Planctomycetes bacterium]|nr:DUF2380 domain-containing protein [Planctomycetota bacterium]
MSGGIQDQDPGGRFHGCFPGYNAGVGWQIILTDNTPSFRGAYGETNIGELGEVIYTEAIPARVIESAELVASPNGTLHVFFTEMVPYVDINSTTKYWLQLFYTSKAWGTTSWTTATQLSVGANLGSNVWREAVREIAPSVASDGTPYCYYEQIERTYTWNPTSHVYEATKAISKLWAKGSGAVSEIGGGVENDLSDTTANLGSHLGHGLWRCHPYPIASTTPRMYLSTGGSATLIRTANLQLGMCALFVTSTGTDHIAWIEDDAGTPKVKYSAGSGGVGSAPFLEVGTSVGVRADINGNIHRFWVNGGSTYHSLWTGSAWSSPVAMTGSGAPLRAIGWDALDRFYVSDGYLGSATMKYMWEPDLGSQDPADMIGIAPGTVANLANGNVFAAFDLFGTAGNGPVPAMTVYYNSQAVHDGSFGPGWRHNYDLYLQSTYGAGYILHMPDGRCISCVSDGSGNFVAEDYFGISFKIYPVVGPGTATQELQTVDGMKWRFDVRGKPVSIADRDGNTMNLAYINNGTIPGTDYTLDTVTDAYSRVVKFTYDNRARVSKIELKLSASVISQYEFGYDAANNRLLNIQYENPAAVVQRKWVFTYYALSGTPSPLPVDITAITGIKGLLASITTPVVAAMTIPPSPANQDSWIGYTEKSPVGTVPVIAGRANVGWDPSVAYAGAAASRKSRTIAYTVDTLYTIGTVTNAFKTTYTDRQSYAWVVYSDYWRSLALKIEDPVNGSGAPTLRAFDTRRNLLAFTDPGSKTVTYTYVDVTEGLQAWVHDLVKTVKLPGETLVTTYNYHTTWNAVKEIIPVTGTGEKTTIGFNGSGHPDSVLKPGDAVAWTAIWNSNGFMTESKDPNLHKVTYTPGSYGLPSSIQVDGVVNSSGYPVPTACTWTAFGAPDTVTPPLQGLTSYAYDGVLSPNQITLPSDNGPAVYGYNKDENGQLHTQTRPAVPATTIVNNVLGRNLQVIDALSQTTNSAWTPNGDMAKFTNVNNQVTDFEQDALGRTTKTLRMVNATGNLKLVNETHFNASSLVDWVAVYGLTGTTEGNPPRQTTNYAYEPTKNTLTKVTLPGGDTEIHYQYDVKRQLVSEETFWNPGTGMAFLKGTGYVYDTQGRATKTVQMNASWSGTGEPLGLATQYQFDPAGDMTKTISPLLHETTMLYDAAHRMTQSTDATGTYSRTIYEGNLLAGTQRQIPDGWGLQIPVRNHYNGLGQVDYSYDNMTGDHFNNLYDASGRLTGNTGPLGLNASMVYDDGNRLTRQQVQKNSTTTLTYDMRYDPLGNMTARWAPPGFSSGPSWTYAYDEGNRQTTANAPIAGHSQTRAYNALGNVTFEEDEDHNLTYYYFDLRNRLTQTVYQHTGGGTWETIDRTYDGASNLTSINSLASGIHVDYVYKPTSSDPHTQWLRKVTWKLLGSGGPAWKVLEYDCDNDGRRTQTRVKDDGTTTSRTQDYYYDDANRLTQVNNNSVFMASFQYAYGFLRKTTFGNGGYVRRFYDKKGRLDYMAHVAPWGQTRSLIEYSYDTRDRRTGVYYSDLDLQSTFTYTDNSWLESESHISPTGGPAYTNLEAIRYGGNESGDTGISAITCGSTVPVISRSISYIYDLRGNRVTKDVAGGTTEDSVYGYDIEDKMFSETRGTTAITYAYAARGDMTSKVVGGVTTNYENDFLGRITHASSTGVFDWGYVYAPTGDRIEKYDIGASGANEWYLPSDGDTLCDYTNSGTETFTGIYVSPGLDGRVARLDPSGTPQYYMSDGQGSVHQVTDSAGGIARKLLTDAWGNNIDLGPGAAPPTGPGDRYGWQGREKDTESGLQFFRARSYDPMTGRFTSRDPVQHKNLYVFAENSPPNAIDPSGCNDQDDYQIESELKNRMYTAKSQWQYDSAKNAMIQFLIDLEFEERERLFPRKAVLASLTQKKGWFSSMPFETPPLPPPPQNPDFEKKSTGEDAGLNKLLARLTDKKDRMPEEMAKGVGPIFSGTFTIVGAVTGGDICITVGNLLTHKLELEDLMRAAPYLMASVGAIRVVLISEEGRVVGRSTEELLEAVARLEGKAPEAKLLTAGKSALRWHHFFPQRADLASKFEALGVDIHEFTGAIPQWLHEEIHSGGPRGGKWNAAWESYFANATSLTKEGVFGQLSKMIHDFEIDGLLRAVGTYPK